MNFMLAERNQPPKKIECFLWRIIMKKRITLALLGLFIVSSANAKDECKNLKIEKPSTFTIKVGDQTHGTLTFIGTNAEIPEAKSNVEIIDKFFVSSENSELIGSYNIWILASEKADSGKCAFVRYDRKSGDTESSLVLSGPNKRIIILGGDFETEEQARLVK